MESRVIFPGHVGDMHSYYNMADAAVSSSRSEGLPFNLLEAMYHGLPVAASRVKGHTDLIKDGENGTMFEPGNPESCRRAMENVMKCHAFLKPDKKDLLKYNTANGPDYVKLAAEL